MYKMIVILLVILLNLGLVVDITQKPEKGDLILCLGGGWHDRIDKSIELYNQKYSNKILYTWKDLFTAKSITFSKYKRLIENGINKNDIIHIDENRVLNTYEELKEAKEYIISNGFKKVLIISHPAHSLRIKIIANTLLDYKKDGIEIISIASSSRKWNKWFIYSEQEAVVTTFKELIKLPYNLIKYSF